MDNWCNNQFKKGCDKISCMVILLFGFISISLINKSTPKGDSLLKIKLFPFIFGNVF